MTVIFSIWHIFGIFFSSLKSSSQVIIMSRSVHLLVMPILLKKIIPGCGRVKIISWLHEIKLQRIHIWVNKRADGIVGTNSAITSDVAKLLGIKPSKLAVSLNPITESQLNQRFDKAFLRKRLNVPPERTLIVYTGKLFIGQREARYILEAAKHCPDYQFLLTGGKPNVIAYYKKWCKENGLKNATPTRSIYFGNFRDHLETKQDSRSADYLSSRRNK